jgi:hypothetical protein
LLPFAAGDYTVGPYAADATLWPAFIEEFAATIRTIH